MTYAIFWAGFVVAVALYLGLCEIAQAIRNRPTTHNVSIPSIRIKYDDGDGDAASPSSTSSSPAPGKS